MVQLAHQQWVTFTLVYPISATFKGKMTPQDTDTTDADSAFTYEDFLLKRGLVVTIDRWTLKVLLYCTYIEPNTVH